MSSPSRSPSFLMSAVTKGTKKEPFPVRVCPARGRVPAFVL